MKYYNLSLASSPYNIPEDPGKVCQHLSCLEVKQPHIPVYVIVFLSQLGSITIFFVVCFGFLSSIQQFLSFTLSSFETYASFSCSPQFDAIHLLYDSEIRHIYSHLGSTINDYLTAFFRADANHCTLPASMIAGSFLFVNQSMDGICCDFFFQL